MMKDLGLFEYPHGGIFAKEHPIDLATHHNLSYIDAFPNMQLRSPQGQWVCPLSNQARDWRRKNDVSFDLKVHCRENCSTNYDSCKSLENHLQARGEKRDYAPVHARVLGGMVETGVDAKLNIRNSVC
jgi:hypothetical protein